MFKHMGLLARRPDMAREAFVQRYEYGHVPLIQKHLGPTFAGYSRNYPHSIDSALSYDSDYDALTQIWYASEEQHERSIAILSNPAVGAEISEDEAHLFYREMLFFFEANEHISAFGAMDSASAKAVFLSTVSCADDRDGRMADMERQFSDALAPFAKNAAAAPFALCRRSYPIPEKVFQHALYDTHSRVPPLVITELWPKAGFTVNGAALLNSDGREVLRLPANIGAPVSVSEFGDVEPS